MSEMRALLLDTADRLLAGHCDRRLLLEAEAGVWPAALWSTLADAGLAAALLPEAAGGPGCDMGDALSLLRPLARHAAPVPLAETLLASWLLLSAGLAVPQGVLTVAPVNRQDRVVARPEGDGWRLSGMARRVPWGRQADGVALLADGDAGPLIALVPKHWVTATPGVNLANEPRDDLAIDARLEAGAVRPTPPGIGRDQLLALGAAMRSVEIAGALARVLDMTVQYAGERVQFGRPIGKFQAVQQNLAVLAGQAAAASAAADIAVDAAADGIDLFAIASAKTRAGEAASTGAALAHQVHGAIGFTQEHMLHFSTRRLWSWRDEFGNEAVWARRIGEEVAAAGAAALWQRITATP
jgi:acyl-CoA dehydrogenase